MTINLTTKAFDPVKYKAMTHELIARLGLGVPAGTIAPGTVKQAAGVAVVGERTMIPAVSPA